MLDQHFASKATTPSELAGWIDDIADQFETAWQSVTPPRLADFLGETGGPRRLALLAELVKLDIAYRRRLGERRQVDDYLGEFPELADPASLPPSPASSFAQTLMPPGADVPLVFSPPAVADSNCWPGVQGYEVLGALGQGGMGVVYKARQLSLNRIVALKMILGGVSARPQARVRFRTEAEAAARLQHPNIVQVYEVGEQDGRPYCAMEYMDGGSLAQRLGGVPQPPRLAAQLTQTLARAVEHAHQQGIVHRDLKPANILLGDPSSVLGHQPEANSGQPTAIKISDFGLAKHLDQGAVAQGCQTETGEVLGTPSYMAPEQAEGKVHAIGPTADVYALGAILYELLTGRPPFRGETLLDTLEQVRTQEPLPPSQLQPRLPRDLQTICLKCLHKDPRKRYPSARTLADDLERYLTGRPILARPVGRTERVWRWCGRNPAVAGLLTTVALLLVGLSVASLGVAVTARAHAEEAQAREEEANDRERERRRETLMQKAQLVRLIARRDGWREDAWQQIREAGKIARDDRLRDEATATLAWLDLRPVKRFLARTHHQHDAPWVALSPDGKRLLLAGGSGSRGETPSEARLWDEAAQKLKTSGKAGTVPGPVAFRPDGVALQVVPVKTSDSPPSLLLWDVVRRQALGECRFADRPGVDSFARNTLGLPVAAVSADGALLAASAMGPGGVPILACWDTTSARRVVQFEAGAVTLALAPDRSLLAAADRRGEIRIWSLPDGKVLGRFQASQLMVHALAFDPRGERLAIGGAGGDLAIWDCRRPCLLSRCHGSLHDVYAVAFSPDGALLASAGREIGRLWDAASGRLLLKMAVGDFVTSLAFSRDGRLAVGALSAFGPADAQVWELENGRGTKALLGLTAPVLHLRFSADGRRLAGLAGNWQAAVWDSRTGRLLRVLDVPPGLVADNAALALGPDGTHFAFAAGNEARLWDVVTGRVLRAWKLPPGLQDRIVFDSSGKRLLLFRVETKERTQPPYGVDPRQHPRVCRLRDLLGPEPKKAIHEIRDFNWHVYTTLVSAQGRHLVIEGLGGPDGQRRSLKVFDGASARELWSSPPVSRNEAHAHVLDPEGKVLAYRTPGEDEAYLLELSSGRRVGKLKRLPHCLGPGVRFLLESSDRGISYALWRRGDRSPLITLGLDMQVSGPTEFSSDGKLVAWGTSEGAVLLSDLAETRRQLATIDLGW